jgi:hypothetical protein
MASKIILDSTYNDVYKALLLLDLQKSWEVSVLNRNYKIKILLCCLAAVGQPFYMYIE